MARLVSPAEIFRACVRHAPDGGDPLYQSIGSVGRDTPNRLIWHPLRYRLPAPSVTAPPRSIGSPESTYQHSDARRSRVVTARRHQGHQSYLSELFSGLGQHLEEIDHAFPMFRRKRNRFPNPSSKASYSPPSPAWPSHLLATKTARAHARLINPRSAGLAVNARPSVDEHESNVGFFDRHLGLLAHAPFKALIRHLFQTSRIDDTE